jgi:LuxR family maltose regulon positive regulatory protein
MNMEDDLYRHNAIQSLRNCRQSINRYLEDEVINSWPEHKRSFALKTSILDALCASLCDAVTGEHDGSRMLKYINERNGFLITLDNEEYKYRYHRMFRDLLYNLLFESDPAAIPDLHIKAAAWYQKHGSYYQAIEHFLSAMRYDEAFELMEQQFDDLCGRNDYAAAFSWIDRLPQAYRDKSFRIAVIYAMYHAEMNNFQLSREWIARMEALAGGSKYTNYPELKGYSSTLCSLAKANLFIREGNINEFLSSIMRAAESNEGNFYKMTEYMDLNTADIYFYRCPYNKFTHVFAEEYNEYYKIVSNYRVMISENPGYAPLAIGEYLYENNRLEEALPYLLEALEEAQFANCPGALVPVMVDISRIKRARGDMPGAFEALEECEKKLKNCNKPHWNYLLNAFRVRLYIDTGNMGGIDRWFDSCKLGTYMEISRAREFELLVFARVLMAKGRLNDAHFLLKRLFAFTEGAGRRHSTVEVLNLLAMLAYQKGEISIAMNDMEKSLAIGMEEHYVRSYADELVPIARLLRHYIMRRSKQKGHHKTETQMSYAKKLLLQVQENLHIMPATDIQAVASGIKELLTEQEKTVLGLLLESNTNKEISIKLGVSLRTVKAHTGNIYSKLGVKNRAQCVRLARAILIPDR